MSTTDFQELVGKPVSAGGPSTAPDPVNQPMIRHWAAAFDDRNPIYTDPDAAAATRHGGIVAPPLMLQTWTMGTPKLEGIRERGGSAAESSGPSVVDILNEAGYRGTLATNSEFEIVRYLQPGEVVQAETLVESISEEKDTRLGKGRFLQWVTTYTVDGEVVGRQLFRILKFQPPVAS